MVQLGRPAGRQENEREQQAKNQKGGAVGIK
jgi:hypothetical protein